MCTLRREPAGNRDNLLLRLLDLGQPDRALGFEIGLEHLGCPLRHIAEELVLQRLVRALERHNELIGRDLAGQHLHATVVDIDETVEDKHVVLDLLRQFLVGAADFLHHRGLD